MHRLLCDWHVLFLRKYHWAFYLRSSIEIEHQSLLLGDDAPHFLPGLVFLTVLQKAAYDAAPCELSRLDLNRERQDFGKLIKMIHVIVQGILSRACSSPPGCPSSCLQSSPLLSGWRNSLCRLCWSCCCHTPAQPCCLNTSSRPPAKKTERSLSPWSIFTANAALSGQLTTLIWPKKKKKQLHVFRVDPVIRVRVYPASCLEAALIRSKSV